MRRTSYLLGAIGLAASTIGACSDNDLIVAPQSLGAAGSGGGASGGRTSTGGRGGAVGLAGSSAAGAPGSPAGAAGSAGVGGTSAAGEVPDAGGDASAGEPDAAGPLLVDAGDAGPVRSCVDAADCDDGNACTTEACIRRVCSFAPVVIGTPCGDLTTTNECNLPDSCDANGVCLTNDQPGGTLCEDGHCSSEGACDCAVDRITVVPYSEQWQTTADTEADFYPSCQVCDNTLDHVVAFTAPQTGSYRFTVTSPGDPELGVLDGDCADALGNATCGADLDPDIEDYTDVLDLEIEAGSTVTVVVGESCEENGGVGTLSIELTPEG